MEIILKYFSDFTEKQLEQFRMLAPLYKEWNEKINVISRKDIESLYKKHVLHSLSIAVLFESATSGFAERCEMADLGTGGGFPGIPMAILFPEVTFHLVDSIAKKLKVVDAVVTVLGLKNVTTQHIRIEEIRNRKFDYVISRAVAPLKDLWQWSKPLLKQTVKREGQLPPGLICLKGGDLTDEVQESATQPRIIEIYQLFPEVFFKEKFMLYIPR